jgi:hypothetical protein
MFVYAWRMPTHRLAFTDPPAELLTRLQNVLATQGSPPIRAAGSDEQVEFAGDTGEFMLRSRAADALTTVWPDWQDNVRV